MSDTLMLQDEFQEALAFTLLVLCYLEQAGLLPERFTSAGLSVWCGIMPYLREADLLEMVVRDGVRANFHLFAPFRDPATRNSLRALDEATWRQKLAEYRSLDLLRMPRRELYRRAAGALGVDLPPMDETLLRGNAFDRSSLIAELPNGCGYPSLLLCEAYDFLDPAHNVRIFTDGGEAEMLAAWALVLLTGQLTLPPGRIVPVTATDSAVLSREAFDVALIYRPVPWLPTDPGTMVTAKEFIRL